MNACWLVYFDFADFKIREKVLYRKTFQWDLIKMN